MDPPDPDRLRQAPRFAKLVFDPDRIPEVTFSRPHRMGRAGAGIIMVALAVWVGTLFTGTTYERLAVLPPTNLLNDPEQEHLILGVYDQLIGELQTAGLTVKARRSMMRCRDGEPPVREIAKEVGVDALIEPSVRWVGDSIEINLRLVDGSTEEYIGNPIVEHVAVRNVIDFYRDLVRQVVDALQLTLSPEVEARHARAGPVNPEAYEDYLNGRFHWGNLTPASLETALGYFESAVEKQPDFAQVHAGQIFAIAGQPDLSEVLQTVYAEEGAQAAWRFAAESASALPHVIPLMVGVLFDYAGDTDEAVSWIQRAVELRDPNAPYLASEPLSSELRNDPRFKKLLRRMNLPVF